MLRGFRVSGFRAYRVYDCRILMFRTVDLPKCLQDDDVEDAYSVVSSLGRKVRLGDSVRGFWNSAAFWGCGAGGESQRYRVRIVSHDFCFDYYPCFWVSVPKSLRTAFGYTVAMPDHCLVWLELRGIQGRGGRCPPRDM